MILLLSGAGVVHRAATVEAAAKLDQQNAHNYDSNDTSHEIS